MSPPLPWIAFASGTAISPTKTERSRGVDELVSRALKEYRKLLLWDLNGMERGRPQLDFYRRFEGKGLWVDAGVTSVDAVIDVLVAGADIAVLNLKAARDMSVVQESREITDKLAICVEEEKGVVARSRELRQLSAYEVFREAARVGVRIGIYLRRGGLKALPSWSEGLRAMELYAGPVKSTEAGLNPWAVVDLMEMGDVWRT